MKLIILILFFAVVATSAPSCIAFVNGGASCDYCYNSGLQNMQPGAACYVYNSERCPVSEWSNNDASDAYWWAQINCLTGDEGGSSSSTSSSSSVPPSQGDTLQFFEFVSNLSNPLIWEFCASLFVAMCAIAVVIDILKRASR